MDKEVAGGLRGRCYWATEVSQEAFGRFLSRARLPCDESSALSTLCSAQGRKQGDQLAGECDSTGERWQRPCPRGGTRSGERCLEECPEPACVLKVEPTGIAHELGVGVREEIKPTLTFVPEQLQGQSCHLPRRERQRRVGP